MVYLIYFYLLEIEPDFNYLIYHPCPLNHALYWHFSGPFNDLLKIWFYFSNPDQLALRAPAHVCFRGVLTVCCH